MTDKTALTRQILGELTLEGGRRPVVRRSDLGSSVEIGQRYVGGPGTERFQHEVYNALLRRMGFENLQHTDSVYERHDNSGTYFTHSLLPTPGRAVSVPHDINQRVDQYIRTLGEDGIRAITDEAAARSAAKSSGLRESGASVIGSTYTGALPGGGEKEGRSLT